MTEQTPNIIKWNRPIPGGPNNGLDGQGNIFQEVPSHGCGRAVKAVTPDGFTSTSHAAQDALEGALAQREAARTSWTVKFPKGATSDDVIYWSDRASEIEGSPIVLSPK